VTSSYVQAHFPALLLADQDYYHAFISYRRSLFADNAAEAMYSYLTLQVLGPRKVAVFRDTVALKNGLEFDKSFMQAMLHSLVVVPLVTLDTLERMKLEDKLTTIDHVLLEWHLALTLLDLKGFPVLRIAPILCGSVS
jgi:hypothetical protein